MLNNYPVLSNLIAVVSYLLQTSRGINFQVKELRQLQQVGHLLCIHSIL